MINRKFSLFVNGLSKLICSHEPVNIKNNEALVCKYEDHDVRIEDGAKVGLHEQVVVMVELTHCGDSVTGYLSLNGDFSITKDGYIAEMGDDAFFYIRHMKVSDSPFQILNNLRDTISIIRSIEESIIQYVVN